MWYACAHVHVHVGICVYMYEYVQRSKAGSECLSLLFSAVLFQTESHTEPGIYGFHKISCTASPRNLHVLPPHC